MMNEYRVTWHQCPRVNHTERVLYVLASGEEDALRIARAHVERTVGITWFTMTCGLAPVIPEGKVL